MSIGKTAALLLAIVTSNLCSINYTQLCAVVVFPQFILLTRVATACPKTHISPAPRSNMSNHATNSCSLQKVPISSEEFMPNPSPIHFSGVLNTVSTSKIIGISGTVRLEYLALSIERFFTLQKTMPPFEFLQYILDMFQNFSFSVIFHIRSRTSTFELL